MDFACYHLTYYYIFSKTEPKLSFAGGDGLDTFNVSTTGGMLMAAAGITVAKHGNRSASGNSMFKY